MARCSSVCGMIPSSAAITSSARSMPDAPATMVRTKSSWPGTSTTPATSAVAQIERREVEIDGDAAPPLLGEPVHRPAGERGDERRFAVIDMAGGADDHDVAPGPAHPELERRQVGALAEVVLDVSGEQAPVGRGVFVVERRQRRRRRRAAPCRSARAAARQRRGAVAAPRRPAQSAPPSWALNGSGPSSGTGAPSRTHASSDGAKPSTETRDHSSRQPSAWTRRRRARSRAGRAPSTEEIEAFGMRIGGREAQHHFGERASPRRSGRDRAPGPRGGGSARTRRGCGARGAPSRGDPPALRSAPAAQRRSGSWDGARPWRWRSGRPSSRVASRTIFEVSL